MSNLEPTHRLAPGSVLFERFEVLELLGEGGFGHVARAKDRESGTQVALKVLHRFDAQALLDLKHEFRSLADIQHPSLVRLGELFEQGGRWGFSMELVPGVDLSSYLRPAGRCDEQRCRDALSQLTEGLSFLHARALLHRDVKPANVLVTPEGRVVLLDFGLVSHLSPERRGSDQRSAATVEYMAPEQATGEPVGPEADFYALGVLLYEALCGHLPFEGSGIQIVYDKHHRVPEPPSRRSAFVPRDLETLCLALLSREPSARPTADEVLLSLGRSAHLGLRPSLVPETRSEVFFGRTRELAELEASLSRAYDEGPSLVLVQGESGVGKTRLVRELSSRASLRSTAPLLLSGRCHAAEQVPFKMFDGVVDELSHHLSSLDRDAASTLYADDAGLLPRLFAVLDGVTPIARLSSARARSPSAAPVARLEAFAAFARLLRDLARRRPLLIVIDDIQWGDGESVQLMRFLLDALGPSPVMFLCTLRPLESLEEPLKSDLRELASHPKATSLSLSELKAQEARALSAHCLGVGESDPRAIALASEAAGHPLFITELAESIEAGVTPSALDLDCALRARAAQLGEAARELVSLLAVAGGPASTRLCAQVLGFENETLERAAADLRQARLARTIRRGELACYHDRVREAVVDGIAEDQRTTLHRKLAQTAARNGGLSHARIATHFIAAGLPERALPHLEEAAQAALRASAFERAAGHYRRMRDAAREASREELHRIRLAEAEALAAAGRCAESARVLLDALEGASGDERRALQVRAAQQLLQAGQIEEGVHAARHAMQDAGLAWPKTPWRVVFRWLWQRAAIGVHGIDAPLRREDEVEPEVLAQLDTLWRLWQPLIWADLLRNAEIGARHLQLALRAGPPRHVGFALLAEATLAAMREAGDGTASRLIAQAAPFAAEARSLELDIYEIFVRGNVAFFSWDLRQAERALSIAERRYGEQCPGEAWMLANVRGSLLSAMFSLGQHRRHAELSAAWLREAEARGDRFAEATYTILGLGMLRPLMEDDVATARRMIERAMGPWRSDSYGVQHLGETVALQTLGSYTGGTDANQYWDEAWPRIRSSFLGRARFSREMLSLWRADAALRAALAETGAAREALLRTASQRVSALSSARTGIALSWSPLIKAQIAILHEQRDPARRLARAACRTFDTAGHFVGRHANLLLAYLDGPRAFEAERASLSAWHAAEGWKEPERAISMWLPVYRALLEPALG